METEFILEAFRSVPGGMKDAHHTGDEEDTDDNESQGDHWDWHRRVWKGLAIIAAPS